MTTRIVSLTPETTVRVTGAVDVGCPVIHVTINVLRNGQTVASFGHHDIERKCRPESRPAINAAVAAVVAELQAGPEFAARVAAEQRSIELETSYAESTRRIINAGLGRC